GPRSASWVKNHERLDVLGTLAYEEVTERLADDVVHDKRRCVEHAARGTHFGLRLDGDAATPDDDSVPQESLVDLAKDVSRQDLEGIGALGRIQPSDDRPERTIVEGEFEAQVIGLLSSPALSPEVEEARVVPVV